jgi:lipid A disaccharide synthetase
MSGFLGRDRRQICLLGSRENLREELGKTFVGASSEKKKEEGLVIYVYISRRKEEEEEEEAEDDEETLGVLFKIGPINVSACRVASYVL